VIEGAGRLLSLRRARFLGAEPTHDTLRNKPRSRRVAARIGFTA
jgi:hypothetical protein